jgi:transcriptional regulator with XRE-family HTH domain
MQTNGQYRIYNPQALGAAVKHFREEAGLTQAQLAAQTGIRRVYLAELEAGKVTEQTQRVISLLRALGVRLVATKADW